MDCQSGVGYKKVIVLGLGVSGEAACMLLLSTGARVTVVDKCVDSADVQERAGRLKSAGAEVILSEKLPEDQYDVCITSPGISENSDWVKSLESCGTEVLSELELGWRYCQSPILAITGSKGKSTMVKFCSEVLSLAGYSAVPAGNYGRPLCSVVMDEAEKDWIVVEVSSFQLEKVKDFRPRIGVLLNVQNDHLDRHGDINKYRAVKARLFAKMNEEEGDTAIILDEEWNEVGKHLPNIGHSVLFGLSRDADYCFRKGEVFWNCNNENKSLSISGTIFDNDITGVMVAAATGALRICGVEPSLIEHAARMFKPLPHRMAEIACVNGVRYINDSKATNLSAMYAALRMCEGSAGIRLIAGGILKEYDLKWMKEILAKEVKCAYLIGNASEHMKAAWGDVIECRLCGTIRGAVVAAKRDAKSKEVVLLSPACASFDQFKNFEERGNQFEQIVRCINEENQNEDVGIG